MESQNPKVLIGKIHKNHHERAVVYWSWSLGLGVWCCFFSVFRLSFLLDVRTSKVKTATSRRKGYVFFCILTWNICVI